jgi:hypothetical protein
MEKRVQVLRSGSIAAAVAVATLGLVFLAASLAAVRTQAAPLDAQATGTDPRIEAITVTSDLPISDTHPGDGVTKTVYFNNNTGGVISVTFEISGTPTLFFGAGTAFDEPGGYVGGSTSPQASFVVVYTVASTHPTQSNVTYAAINGVLSETSIAISYVRDVASPAVTVTAPTDSSTVPFSVTWEAVDPGPGSGVASYTVAYREDEGAWETWYASTTITESTFLSATVDHTYVFSVTAYDRISNWGVGTATVQGGTRYVYLPVVMKSWVWWYSIDVYERNDSPDEAYGPLVSGQDYDGYIWDATDPDDYYWITPTTVSQVNVTLTNIPAGTDYDLYVYYHDGAQYQPAVDPSINPGNQNESVTFTPPVLGTKYYIRVYPASGSSSQQPYCLRATYD